MTNNTVPVAHASISVRNQTIERQDVFAGAHNSGHDEEEEAPLEEESEEEDGFNRSPHDLLRFMKHGVSERGGYIMKCQRE